MCFMSVIGMPCLGHIVKNSPLTPHTSHTPNALVIYVGNPFPRRSHHQVSHINLDDFAQRQPRVVEQADGCVCVLLARTQAVFSMDGCVIWCDCA
jgi:hypothetical protein